jgi:hypothetical protein
VAVAVVLFGTSVDAVLGVPEDVAGSGVGDSDGGALGLSASLDFASSLG